MLKAFGICFVAVHLPLMALICYLLFSENPGTMPVVVVSLVATLTGTIFAIRAMAGLLSPLDRISEALASYGNGAGFTPLGIERHDEVGRIADGVESLVARLDASLDGLRRQAMTDPLTAIGNRRWLVEEVNGLFARARREGGVVSVCIFDLDHFKRINDTHGHDVGDIVLMSVAETVRQRVRPYDLLARWGGEEFCLVVSGASAEQPGLLAERLRAAIAAMRAGPMAPGQVTASFGIATGPARGADFATLLSVADKALYDAKTEGRNRVVALDVEPSPAPAEPDRAGLDAG
ncbi:diguanylate cyclase [Segnochrobactraceae bacterium EtOH-i3]